MGKNYSDNQQIHLQTYAVNIEPYNGCIQKVDEIFTIAKVMSISPAAYQHVPTNNQLSYDHPTLEMISLTLTSAPQLMAQTIWVPFHSLLK